MMRWVLGCVLAAVLAAGPGTGASLAGSIGDDAATRRAAADAFAAPLHLVVEGPSRRGGQVLDRSVPFRTVSDIKRHTRMPPFLVDVLRSTQPARTAETQSLARPGGAVEPAGAELGGGLRSRLRRLMMPLQRPFQRETAGHSGVAVVPSEPGPPVPPRPSSVERPRTLRTEVTRPGAAARPEGADGWQAAPFEPRWMRFELTARSRTLVVRGVSRAARRAPRQRDENAGATREDQAVFEPPVPQQSNASKNGTETARTDEPPPDAGEGTLAAGEEQAGQAATPDVTAGNSDAGRAEDRVAGQGRGGSQIAGQRGAEETGSLQREADDESSDASQSESEAPTDPELAALRERVSAAIDVSSRRYLTIDVHTPWQIMHGVLALRDRFMIKTPQGELIPAIRWLRNGATFQGESVFLLSEDGVQGHPYTQPYIFQGHPCQFFAMLTMLDLPPEAKFVVQGREVTIADFIRHAKANVNDNEEVTWVLWSLSHYLPPDARWVNKYGEPWSIERLVQTETQNEVAEGACGGTHGLFALAYARNRYRATGRPLKGVWAAAHRKLRYYVERTRELQNSDGSFSTEFYAGPGYSTEFETRIDATGHCLEWLMVALEDEELEQPWVRSAVRSLAGDLIENKHHPARCGPLYHSVHALVLFQERTSNVRVAGQAVKARQPAAASRTPQ